MPDARIWNRRRPRRDLLFRVMLQVYRMNGVIEEASDSRSITGAVVSDKHAARQFPKRIFLIRDYGMDSANRILIDPFVVYGMRSII
jgi:hypothetical protein